MTTNLSLFLSRLQKLAPISAQSAQIDSHFFLHFQTELPISNQKTQQSYNFKGISFGSSDENIFFTADGVKFSRPGFRHRRKVENSFSVISHECYYRRQQEKHTVTKFPITKNRFVCVLGSHSLKKLKFVEQIHGFQTNLFFSSSQKLKSLLHTILHDKIRFSF